MRLGIWINPVITYVNVFTRTYLWYLWLKQTTACKSAEELDMFDKQQEYHNAKYINISL